jgi:phage terminase large subunit
MAYDKANVLVVRKVADTLADSCYALLEKCAWNLGVHQEFKFSKSPLKIIYKRTGQQIIFRGLDDFQKLTSLDVTYGNLCWMWVEEAYQITRKEDFDRIDESIRGVLPNGLFKRIMLTFNPWNKTHWLRTAFFETEDGKPLNDPDVYSHTTNYLMNEWLEEADYKLYERMKRLNPRQYEVAGLGNWGSPEGLIYENWEEFDFDFNAVARREGVVAINGLDFGFSADPTALVCMLYDEAHYELYIYDELYVRGYTSQMRYDAICKKGHKHSVIYYDSAGSLDSAELMELGMSNLIPYNKAGEKNSILNGINFIRSLKIYVHPRCVNTLTEFENYMWYVDKDGVTQPKPQPGSLDHAMDGIRYGVMGYKQSSGGGFIGSSDDESWKEQYQYDLLTDEEIEQRKKDVANNQPEKKEEPKDDDDDDGLEWCYST